MGDQHSNTCGVFSLSLLNIKVQIFVSESATTLCMFTSFGVLISAQDISLVKFECFPLFSTNIHYCAKDSAQLHEEDTVLHEEYKT